MQNSCKLLRKIYNTAIENGVFSVYQWYEEDTISHKYQILAVLTTEYQAPDSQKAVQKDLFYLGHGGKHLGNSSKMQQRID